MSAASLVDAFDQRMTRTNETQAYVFSKNQEVLQKPRQSVTEESRVRLMYGISVASVAEESRVRSDDSSVTRVMFSRTSDGQNLELDVKATAVPLIKSLTSKPQQVDSLACGDRFERLCVLQMLLEHGVLQLFLAGQPPGAEPEED